MCQGKRRRHEQDKENLAILEAEEDKKHFWRIMKSKKSAHTAPQVTNEVWVTHFKELYTLDKDPILEVDPIVMGHHDYGATITDSVDILDYQISRHEITHSIVNQPNRKAAGPDRITYDLIKTSLGVVYNVLFVLFNVCFDQAMCPSSWLRSHQIPLYKGKGPLKAPGSYRGINLLSFV